MSDFEFMFKVIQDHRKKEKVNISCWFFIYMLCFMGLAA